MRIPQKSNFVGPRQSRGVSHDWLITTASKTIWRQICYSPAVSIALAVQDSAAAPPVHPIGKLTPPQLPMIFTAEPLGRRL